MVAKITKETINQIIPEKLQTELMNRGTGVSNGLWAVGDTIDLVVEEKPSGVRKATMYSACAVLTGLSVARVGDVLAVAKFYPVEVREQFEVLTFSHFLVAKAAGDLDEAKRYLQIAVDSADDYGGVRIPVDKLRELVAPEKEEDDREDWEKFAESGFKAFSNLVLNSAADEIPEWLTIFADEVVNMMSENGYGDD
jgi:hypothetical protein